MESYLVGHLNADLWSLVGITSVVAFLLGYFVSARLRSRAIAYLTILCNEQISANGALVDGHRALVYQMAKSIGYVAFSGDYYKQLGYLMKRGIRVPQGLCCEAPEVLRLTGEADTTSIRFTFFGKDEKQ